MKNDSGNGKCILSLDIPMDLRTFFDLANTVMVVLCEDQTVAMINPKGCQVLGKSEKEIVHKDWFKYFVSKTDRPKMLKAFRLLMRGKFEPVGVFKCLILTEKGERLYLWHNNYLKDIKGHIRFAYCVGMDITDLRRHSANSKIKRLIKRK